MRPLHFLSVLLCYLDLLRWALLEANPLPEVSTFGHRNAICTSLRLRGGAAEETPKLGSFDVLFLGSGVSTGVPKLGCIVRPDPSLPKCNVCHDALSVSSKNKRSNVSILVRYYHPDGSTRHIMVDAGKTMRETCMRLLPMHGIRSLDALLITHGHADAIFGLDDIRDFQEQNGQKLASSKPLPVFLNEQTFSDIKTRFSYLVPGAKGNKVDEEKKETGSASGRFVSQIEWNTVSEDPNSPFEVEGLTVTPLPVIHGGSLISLGFEFTSATGQRFVYVSDVSSIPESVAAAIAGEGSKGPPSVLVLDALSRKPHFSHLSLEQAVQEGRRFAAKRLLLVGMTCTVGDHAEVNAELAELGAVQGSDQAWAQLAHDGLMLRAGEWDQAPLDSE